MSRFKKIKDTIDALSKVPVKRREKIKKELGMLTDKQLEKEDAKVLKELDKMDKPLTSLDKSRAKAFGINTKNKSNMAVRAKIEEKTAERIMKDKASSYEPRFKKRGGRIGNSKINGNKFVASLYGK